MKRAYAGGNSKGGARLLPVRCLPGQADLVSGSANCVYVGQGSCISYECCPTRGVLHVEGASVAAYCERVL